MIEVEFLLNFLICASEKAASLARKIRSEKELFSLLIQEKDEANKNQRFAVDFKTLADVLIQETIRHDLRLKIPDLAEQLFGEESNSFTNALGQTIKVVIQNSVDETTDLLGRVLDGNVSAAKILSQLVHADVFDFKVEDEAEAENRRHSSLCNVQLKPDNIAFWVDPIDCTAEYVHGSSVSEKDPVSSGGLRNVTVLIGAFFIDSGRPFLGCLNQPFATSVSDDPQWEGRLIWGLHLHSMRMTNLAPILIDESQRQEPIKIISSSTDVDNLSTTLKSPDFVIHSAPGAGYKLFCVITGAVDAYILNKPNTFQWDSCGPHAILLAQGGGCLRFSDVVGAQEIIKKQQLDENYEINYKIMTDYHDDGGDLNQQIWCNRQGLLAYRDESVLWRIIDACRSI